VARATPRGKDGLLVLRDKGIPHTQELLTEALAICLNFCGRRSSTQISLKDLADFPGQIEEVLVAAPRNGTERLLVFL
jgi:hypothetical protein